MNYREITKRLKSVRHEMQKEIPNYWQSRIDRMMAMYPPLAPKPTLYLPENIIDIIGWKYKDLEILKVNPMDDDTMVMQDYNPFN